MKSFIWKFLTVLHPIRIAVDFGTKYFLRNIIYLDENFQDIAYPKKIRPLL